MSSRRLLILPLIVLATAGAARGDDEIESNQAIVELKPGFSIEAFVADYDAVLLGSIERERTYLIELPEVWDEETFEQYIEENDDRVEEAELNYRTEAAEGQTESFYLLVEPILFERQYTWVRLGVPIAHQQSTGDGVIVALVDTGADVGHELLAGRIVAGGFNFVENNDDVSDVGNQLDDDGDGLVDELVGHGTFMAGLIAGTAPDAGLLVVRALDSDGMGSSFRVARAVYYALDHGADIINLSLAMDGEHEVLQQAIRDARDAGVVVVAAAGNLDQREPAAFPAVDETTIGVASTDAEDHKSTFSNYGEHIAISAPGTAVVSSVPGNLYGQWEGTSISSALVSGAAALLRALDPQATPASIESTLGTTAVDLDVLNPQYAGRLGRGRLDVAAAVQDLAGEGLLGDLDANGRVDFADLLILLGEWGRANSPADLNHDGTVDFADLLVLLGRWT